MSSRDDADLIYPRQINHTESRQLALLLNLVKYKNGLSFAKIRKIMPEFYHNDNLDSDQKKLHRDIEELRELGFTVKQLESYYGSGQENNLYYQLVTNRQEKKIQFSQQELETLSLIFARYYPQFPITPELQMAARKLFAAGLEFFPEIEGNDSGQQKKEKEEWQNLYTIIKSIHNKTPLRIEYYKHDPEQTEERTIEPYEIIKRNSLDFYLIAYDRDKKAKRKFIIPKILTSRLLSGTFITRPQVTEEDKNYHPLSFTIHEAEIIELECFIGLGWKLEKFLYPHPYQVEGNHYRLTTTNRSALYSFLHRQNETIAQIHTTSLRTGFRKYLEDLKKKYQSLI